MTTFRDDIPKPNESAGTALEAPEPDTLLASVNARHQIFADCAAQIATGLPTLLDELRNLSFDAAPSIPKPSFFVAEDIAAQPTFLETLHPPFETLESSGVMGNPWSAAALERLEVRNTSVLGWFLDPRGRHGLGNALLLELLRLVGRNLPNSFPANPSPRCTVSVEKSPDGDQANRIDIQIDDASFFLAIEVKIDAPEQPDQIKRYCEVAERYCEVAETRPLGQRRQWALVFLTPTGKPPKTAGNKIDYVVPLSWGHIASALRRIARHAPEIPRFLARSFAAHIVTF